MTPPDIAKLREALEPFANVDDLQISELEYQCGKGCVARAREALALQQSAEAESGPTEEQVARKIFDWLGPDNAFDYPHNLLSTRYGMAARTVRALFIPAPPASQPAEVEVEQ